MPSDRRKTALMSEVRINQQKIVVGDESLALLSGEVHYWRLAPEAWRPILRRVGEMGLRIVASYVCWEFHELAPGRFDFTGETDPRRNLPAFLDLLAEEDFWVIIRPGPYIYAEWLNGGVPDHVARYHRGHPQFRAAARPYMEAVVDVIRPHLATNGGRIILFQAENEIDPWPHWYIEQLGLGRTPGPFQTFLEQQYGDVAALNAAWNSDFTAFAEARATRLLLPDQPDMMRRYLDFNRFRHAYVNDVARWNVETYRELGVDVPIYLNTYGGVETQHGPQLEQIADLAGPDIYPSNEFAHRTNEHRNFMDSVRFLRTYSKLPHIPEFQAGIWHDWMDDVKVLSPNHYRLVCLSALLAGAVGWNWYMIANRDNWYLSPINEQGRTRPPLFAAFRQIVALFDEVDPPSLTKIAPTALTYAPSQRATTRPGQPLLQAFYDAGIDYDFFDPESEHNRLPAPALLFYAGGPWLPRAAHDRLLAYVLGGGHLVCLGEIPRYDEQMRPYNALGIPAPQGIVNVAPGSRPIALQFPGHEQEMVAGCQWLFNYNEVPGEPITGTLQPISTLGSEELELQFNLPAGSTYTVGFSAARAQGRLTVLGLAPNPELLLALHDVAGVSIPVRSRQSLVTTALFRTSGDQGFYLFAVNNGDSNCLADLTLDPRLAPAGRYAVSDLLSGERRTVALDGSAPLPVLLPRKDGTVLHLARDHGDSR